MQQSSVLLIFLENRSLSPIFVICRFVKAGKWSESWNMNFYYTFNIITYISMNICNFFILIFKCGSQSPILGIPYLEAGNWKVNWKIHHLLELLSWNWVLCNWVRPSVSSLKFFILPFSDLCKILFIFILGINKVKKVKGLQFWRKGLIWRWRGIKCQIIEFLDIFSEMLLWISFHDNRGQQCTTSGLGIRFQKIIQGLVGDN